MTFSTTFLSGDKAATGSPAQIPCVIGCCPLLSSGIKVFDPGDNVASVLGGSGLTDLIYYLHRTTGQRVVASIAAPTWSAAPSVTHNGTGPTVTAALAQGASGCFDDHTILVTVTTGGANGVATASIAYDGSTAAETIIVPAEPAPHLIGTVDLGGLTLSSLNSTTLVFTAPAALTVTFTTPTNVQGIADQINTQAIAGTSTIRAQISQGTGANVGKQFLDLYTTNGGAGVSLTIDAPTSTGEAILGFSSGASNLTATGAAATMTLPYTGISLTFAAGTYVKGDTYQLVCVGPRASIQAIENAVTAAHDNYTNQQFGFFAVAQPSDTASNCAALFSALATQIAGYRSDANAPIYPYFVVGSPFHTASSNTTTNEANIATADAALLAAFSSSPAALDSVAVDDIYIPGSAALHAGSFRRSAAWAWTAKRAGTSKLGSDVAEDLVTEASLVGPDGFTRARNEASATTKLGPAPGGLSGSGFAVLRSTSAGLGSPKFSAGVTRAGSPSRLRFSHVVAVACEIARITFSVVESWVGQTPPTNPITGQLLDSEAQHRADTLTSILAFALTPEGAPPNVSSFSVSIDNSGKFIDTGILPVTVAFVPLGLVLEVKITITATGTVMTTNG